MKNPKMLWIPVLLSMVLPMFMGFAAEKADIVLLNGRIATVDKGNHIVQALAVKGDKILAVGTTAEIKACIIPETKVIDLQGKFAMPGFIDSHGHFLSLGMSKMELDLTAARSWEEIVSMVATAAAKAKPGEWIHGRGWHQEKWDKKPQPKFNGLPVHDLLSKAVPDNPVILVHASGHSCLVNARAMGLAGVTRETPNPAGGEIIKDKSGQPIGAFLETAQDLIYAAKSREQAGQSPAEVLAKNLKAIRLAQEECLQKGVTSFHDAGESFTAIDIFKQVAQEGKLVIRLYVMIGEDNTALKKRISQYHMIGFANSHLTVRAIKRLIDGALGSKGAWLLQPYNDLPGSTGLNTEPAAVMKETARIAMANDFQLCTHAIGDRANRETLDIYEDAFRQFPEKKDLRWRIEHAQQIDPADIPRFGKLGVIAAMQGIHCTSDGPWVISRLGKNRAEAGAYVWRKLISSGALISNGTDAPVEGVDPIPCFYASVTRKLKDGTFFFPDQRLTREEALRSYTINGAYAAFEEKTKGSLEPGKLADIVILSSDLLSIPEEKIPEVKVLCTIIGGRVLYEAEKGR